MRFSIAQNGLVFQTCSVAFSFRYLDVNHSRSFTDNWITAIRLGCKKLPSNVQKLFAVRCFLLATEPNICPISLSRSRRNGGYAYCSRFSETVPSFWMPFGIVRAKTLPYHSAEFQPAMLHRFKKLPGRYRRQTAV